MDEVTALAVLLSQPAPRFVRSIGTCLWRRSCFLIRFLVEWEPVEGLFSLVVIPAVYIGEIHHDRWCLSRSPYTTRLSPQWAMLSTISIVSTLTRHTRPSRFDHPLLVVGKPVAVEPLPDRRVPGLPLLVLVEHPLEGGAAAQPVLPRPRRHPGQCRPLVQGDRPPFFVGPQDGPLRINPLPVLPLQRVRLGGLEPDVQVQQLLSHLGPVVEVGVQGQAGELPQQVHGVFAAVGGIVEYGVGVGENLIGGDAVFSGPRLEVVAPTPAGSAR